MNTGMMALLNLALLAAVGLLYTSFATDDSVDDGRRHLVYITTLPEGSPDFPQIQSATEAIATDWDCRVSVMRTTDDAPALARALKRAIVLAPDGISMPGSGDESLLLPFVTEAERQGIPVTFHTTPMNEALRRYGKAGAGLAGGQGESSGYTLTESAVNRLQLSNGTPVMLAGTNPAPVPGSRLNGALAFLRSRNIEPEYLQVTPLMTGPSVPIPDANLERRVSAGTLPRLIVWEAGPVEQLTTLLLDKQADASNVSVATLVPIEEPLALLQYRYVTVQAQNHPFLACYYTLVQLQLTCRYKIPGIEIPTGDV